MIPFGVIQIMNDNFLTFNHRSKDPFSKCTCIKMDDKYLCYRNP